jgi:hypothetical protein
VEKTPAGLKSSNLEIALMPGLECTQTLNGFRISGQINAEKHLPMSLPFKAPFNRREDSL